LKILFFKIFSDDELKIFFFTKNKLKILFSEDECIQKILIVILKILFLKIFSDNKLKIFFSLKFSLKILFSEDEWRQKVLIVILIFGQK